MRCRINCNKQTLSHIRAGACYTVLALPEHDADAAYTQGRAASLTAAPDTLSMSRILCCTTLLALGGASAHQPAAASNKWDQGAKNYGTGTIR
jgi:hypothetical protein